MATKQDPNDDYSFNESLRKRLIESELGLGDSPLESLSTKDLIKLVLSYKVQLDTAKAGYKEALLNPQPIEVNAKVEIPQNSKLGLFAEIVLRHLESLSPTDKLYKVNGSSDTVSNIHKYISNPDTYSKEAYEWLNLIVSFSIDKLKLDQQKGWSEEDDALTNLILNQPSDKVSLYTTIKVLRQSLDRASSSLFKLGKKPDNNNLKQFTGITDLIKKLYSSL